MLIESPNRDCRHTPKGSIAKDRVNHSKRQRPRFLSEFPIGFEAVRELEGPVLLIAGVHSAKRIGFVGSVARTGYRLCIQVDVKTSVAQRSSLRITMASGVQL
jgi:hypothetical protein